MNKVFRFDSKLQQHKKPFGAVVCGEKIKLSAYSLCTEISSCNAVIFSEYEQTEFLLPLVWTNRKRNYDVLSVDFFAPEKPDILWYWFECETFDGNMLYVGKNGVFCDKNHICSYQLTVYSKQYQTPKWFSEGVTYHIFVDRFNRATISPPLVEDNNFHVHRDKNETPHFEPDKYGIVQNKDIYGGNLDGIREKLPYLSSLGVTTIYLSPVFEAWSNHKYNTADYKKIDSQFGDEEALERLCLEAQSYGMRVILDGVFSHTGSDSIYFNRGGRYGENVGAWRDLYSQYRDWYDIKRDGTYSSWWGIDTLPQVNELNNGYLNFIIEDEVSVIAKWMRAGVSGWRLDVADELPDEFISKLKNRARKEKRDALVIGEVWEDASTKKAYGVSKKYFTEGVLDGVMNYPLKNAILDFLCNRISAKNFKEAVLSICENYPDVSKLCLMNIIGTHDTVRVINELSVGSLWHESKENRAERRLSEEEVSQGKTRLRQAAVLQYMFPGSPCIYYGDEIGMQGFEDPFNRRFFAWDDMDEDLLAFYRSLGKIKCENKSMHSFEFCVHYAKGDVVSVSRGDITAFVNRGNSSSVFKVLKNSDVILENGGCCIAGKILYLAPRSCCIIKNE